MEAVKLSKTELKILKAIKKYSHADIGYSELNGYLKFPPAEDILKALGYLTAERLIEERCKPLHGYELTRKGEKYLSSIKFSIRNIMPDGRDIALAIISAAIGAIINGLL